MFLDNASHLERLFYFSCTFSFCLVLFMCRNRFCSKLRRIVTRSIQRLEQVLIIRERKEAIHVKIGEIIKQYRKEKRMSQEMLARQTGISTMSIRRYESGERKIRADDLKKISQVLHIPPSALFGFGPSEENSILTQVELEIKTLSEDELKQVHSYIEFLQMQRK